MPKSKNKLKDKLPKVHKELEGFKVGINEFGEIVSNKTSAELNQFLNKHTEDKKFVKK